MGEISLQSDPLISVYAMYIQVFKIIFQTNEIFIAFFIQVLAHLPNTKHFLSFLPTPTQHCILLDQRQFLTPVLGHLVLCPGQVCHHYVFIIHKLPISIKL